jgi:nucleoid-associated protein YgaU
MAFALSARAQNAPTQADIANLQEDVRGLTQRVNDLSLQVEQLVRDRAESRVQRDAAERSYATVAQLNQAVAELNRAIQSAVANSKDEVLQRVGEQMEKLARQTNAALDSLAKSEPAPQAVAAEAASGRRDHGGAYVVQKGDTLESISKKTGAAIPDIINANRIADPSRILVGQTLIIPDPAGK